MSNPFRWLLRGLALLLLVPLLGLLASAGAARWAAGRVPPAPVRWAADSATVQTAAGPEYAASGLWRALWGTGYRALWAAPVTAPVLRLGPAAPGGLRPLRAGGNFQTRTLHLASDDGRPFVLRSVNKDAAGTLGSGAWHALLGPLLRDQTRAGHPYGAYVAARLAQAAGVLHTNPQLVYVPAQAALGRFGAAFAPGLYLLEERPAGDARQAETLGAAPEIVSSEALLRALGPRPPSPGTARAYLRARLLDLWLGDWSRRADQWRWARMSGPAAAPSAPAAPAPPEYRPIPRDRDQAFYLFDGGYPRLVAACVPKYQRFGPALTAGQVQALAHTARPLDQRLLAGLSPAAFRAEAAALQRRLTDPEIEAALRCGPPEIIAQNLALLRQPLRARRAQLPQVAGWFYASLNEE